MKMEIPRGWLWKRWLTDLVRRRVGVCRYKSERFDCARSLEWLDIDRAFLVVQVTLLLVPTTTLSLIDVNARCSALLIPDHFRSFTRLWFVRSFPTLSGFCLLSHMTLDCF